MFDRLLVGKTTTKAFIIRNTSLLPCKLKLAGEHAAHSTC